MNHYSVECKLNMEDILDRSGRVEGGLIKKGRSDFTARRIVYGISLGVEGTILSV